MKKLCMTLVALFIAVCASAQVYVGGSVGVSSVDYGGDDDETTYKLVPEIGYKFNDTWSAGIAFGWSKEGVSVTNGYNGTYTQMCNAFEFNPYARYNILRGKMVNVFCDASVGYKHYNKVDVDQYQIGLKPGVELKLDRFSLIAHVGFIGWEQQKQNGGGKISSWGVDLDGTNILLGLYYNF